MPVNARRVQSTLAANLLDPADVPHKAMRYAETTIKRHMFAQEDAAVRKLWTIYRDSYDRLQALATMYGERFGIRKLGNEPNARLWRDAFMTDVINEARGLTNQCAALALRAASNAYRQGYYGRLWLLDISTKPDVRINIGTMSDSEAAQALLREDVYDDLIRSLLGREWRLQFADQLDDMIIRIRLSIGSGMSAGEGIDDIMRRVRDVMGIDTDRRLGGAGSPINRQMRANFNRVQTITRTVVNTASNSGAHEAYRRNEDILSGYEWLTARDERVCPECRGLAGTTYRLNDFYRPPAHPNCILPGNEVVLPGELIGASKSYYVGRCIEIRVKSGRSLTVTQNHPILTPFGWVAAKELRTGQYVFSSANIERIATAVNPDDDHRPTAVEDVFEALEKSGTVMSSRVKVSAEDFYGDALFFDGDVNIINTNRLLLSDRVTMTSKPASQSTFNDSGMSKGFLFAKSTPFKVFDRAFLAPNGSVSFFDERLPFSDGHSFYAGIHSLAPITRIDPVFNQSPPNDRTGYTESLGNCLLTFASEIAVDGIGGQCEAFRTNIDTKTVQSSPKDFVIDTSLASEFLNAFTGDVALDEIVDVRYFDFSDHVYDLHVSPYELYTCNGVIVKNCRCTIIPIIAPAVLAVEDEQPRSDWSDWMTGLGIGFILDNVA